MAPSANESRNLMSKSLRDDLLSLLALQGIDSQLERAKATLAAADNGASALAAYNAQKKIAEGLRATATKAQSEQKDAELKLESIETKRKQVNKTLYGGSVSGSRELENLQKELEMLGRQKVTAEDVVLETMEAAAAAVATAEAAEKEQLACASRFKKTRAAFEAKSKELTAEIATLQAPRDAAAKEVSHKDLLARYDLLRGKKQGIGCSAVSQDDTCGACHTRVNSQSAYAARLGEEVTLCEHCHRILTPLH